MEVFEPDTVELERLPEAVRNEINGYDQFHRLRFLDPVAQPVLIGMKRMKLDISLNIKNISNHIVFRFISMAGKPVPWPPSFGLVIGEKLIGKTLNDSSLFHYLPDQLRSIGYVTIECQSEITKSVLIIQEALDDEDLVFKIPRVPHMTSFGSRSPCKSLQFPARSALCASCPYMELDAFILFVERKGKCPFCGRSIGLDSTVVCFEIDHEAAVAELNETGGCD
jgi:hypothetical protein